MRSFSQRLRLLIPLAVMGWCGLVPAVQAQGTGSDDREPAIAVTATGSVSLTPDRAIVSVSVVTRDPQATRAAEQNAQTTAAVRTALRRLLHLPDDSLPTTSYAVQTERDRQSGRPTGYTVQNSLDAPVGDLSRVGQVVDAALGAGASNIEGLRFEASRADSARLEALSRATQQARREADAIAKAAGGRLGRLIEATSGGFTIPRPYAQASREAMVMSAETPITPSTVEVTATVSARWAFLQSP